MPKLVAALAGLVVLLAGTGGAPAADISIVSMQYSAAYPVPHLHYEGETAPGDVDQLRAIYDRFVKCRLACMGPDGSATAILTLNGPGGSYVEGLNLAEFLRENRIGTVVERGMQCYSACAFAFLGGTGYSPQEGVGDFIVRMVEPGSIVGFHAPYYDAAAFAAALEQRGAIEAQGSSRSDLALMVKELVKWNVDPEVIYYFMNMGPDDTYNLLAADDLFLARTALPPTKTRNWITDIPTAVKNACTYLLAIDERGDPAEMQDRFLSEYTDNIGKTRYDGAISGYVLGERPLDIGLCGITESALQSDGDFDVALYYTPGLDGLNDPGTSLFNRQNAWSSAGVGHNPLKRIMQKGALNTFYLPLGIDIDTLDLPGEMEIDLNRFNDVSPPEFASLPGELTVDSAAASTRISHAGNIWVFEQVGRRLLFDSALGEDAALGRTYSNDAVDESGFIREGTYDDTGAAFSWFGFLNGDDATVVSAIVAPPEGAAATADDLAALRRIQCAFAFEGLQLNCGG
jgi:hypothetical protein